ncbi:hypothetical protein HANVADRAFT_74321 [Hanseniaspora valbyensis NRRL Y-1626]|uniref:Uncharacterized protein n=1 Tax=Hanseniaspora valbyensis NRRL Y-1626 TaxID=766949 RepID=A0A1B7TDC6_9ASCO|nr:hypothetical protein HANVADRAFT_74321 [Hanseniaspora valbyensis NRRL Y-1626]
MSYFINKFYYYFFCFVFSGQKFFVIVSFFYNWMGLKVYDVYYYNYFSCKKYYYLFTNVVNQ